MDLAPADVMLITHHRDRPGTVGRVGAMLGEADVNISSMTLARSAPRADAYMVLALDDDVPDDRRPGARGGRRDHRRLGGPPGRRPVTDGRPRRRPEPAASVVPEGLDATLVLLRHGESEWIVENRFQGQSETPLSPLGHRQGALAGERLAAPARRAPPCRSPTAGRWRSSTPRSSRAAQTAGYVADAIERHDGVRVPVRARSPGSWSSARASGRACTRTRSRAR